MFKLLLFIWPKAELTRREFSEYYERDHAPLGARLTGGATDYRRNYPQWDERCKSNSEPFGVMTEVWHEERAQFEAQIAARMSVPAKTILDNDEAKFMNRERKCSVVVDERCVSFPDRSELATVNKLVRFAFADDDAPPNALRQTHEARVQNARRDLAPCVVHYACNYPRYDDPFTSSAELFGSRVAVVEEVWVSEGDGQGDLVQAFPSTASGRTFTVRVRECRTPGGRLVAPLASDLRGVDRLRE
ncbi:MAG: EthD domain-containing protein [Steroidobacteraceae bacterium]